VCILHHYSYVSFFAHRAKKETQIELTQLGHSASQRRVFACGSKVLYDQLCAVFPRGARKNRTPTEIKYRLAAARGTWYDAMRTRLTNEIAPWQNRFHRIRPLMSAVSTRAIA
jgi:hypothetical protein